MQIVWQTADGLARRLQRTVARSCRFVAAARWHSRRHALWSSTVTVNQVARSVRSLATILGVFISLLSDASAAWGYNARVAWTPVVGAVGYKVYMRQDGQQYGPGIDVGAINPDPDGVIRYVATGLPLDVAQYFAVTRYNTSKVESAFSNEVSLTSSRAALAVLAAESRGRPHHRQPLDLSRARSFVVTHDTRPLSGVAPAAAGSVYGGGSTDLVVGDAADGDRVKVYRLRPHGRPQLLGEVAAFAGSNISSSSNLAVGDVVSCEPGDEIVVADDGSRRRASLVRVFGGFADGNPHLVLGFRALSARAAARRPLAYALGDVLPDSDHAGQEIVVGDRWGRIYVFGIRASGTDYTTCDVEAALLRRFAAFPDLPEATAYRFGVGDLVPDNPGDEIAVGDDGTRQAGLVRVLDGRGVPLLEFQAFAAGQAPNGVDLWVADVIPTRPGAELILGQGDTDGPLRVFSIAQGVPTHVMDVSDRMQLATSMWPQLAARELSANPVIRQIHRDLSPVAFFGFD